MSNRRKARHGRNLHHLSPEGRLPVDAYTAAELHQFLVSDAVKMWSTHLPWQVAAFSRIGALERIGAEAAFLRWYNEVKALTGREPPIYSGPIVGGR